jgi:hypothetical protein
MYLAKVLPGKDPIVTEVDEAEGFISASGAVAIKQREGWSRRLPGGGAAALAGSRSDAVRAALCVMELQSAEREVQSKRDRS